MGALAEYPNMPLGCFMMALSAALPLRVHLPQLQNGGDTFPPYYVVFLPFGYDVACFALLPFRVDLLHGGEGRFFYGVMLRKQCVCSALQHFSLERHPRKERCVARLLPLFTEASEDGGGGLAFSHLPWTQ